MEEKNKLSLGLIAAIFIGIIGLGTLLNFLFNADTVITNSTTNSVAEFTLPDGTKYWLNKNSEVKYTSTFGKEHRKIELNGEGYFEVTSDKTKPFVITTKLSTVEVLGTSFSIKAFDEDKNAVLAVSEGKVAFSSDKDKQVFVAGEKGILYKDKKIMKYQLDDNDFAWQKGILTYKNALLKEVFDDLERVYGVSVSIQGANIDKCSFTGDLSTKNLEQNLEVLELTNGLLITKDGDQVMVKGDGC